MPFDCRNDYSVDHYEYALYTAMISICAAEVMTALEDDGSHRFIFAEQFCGLFGISGGETLAPSMAAIRIVSIGFTFCSAVSITTSYYMLIDHIGMATCISCLQNGLFYIIIPVLLHTLFGTNGMWAGFAIAPLLTLAGAMLFVYLRFGKEQFPFLLRDMESDIEVIDGTLTKEAVSWLSETVGRNLSSRQYSGAVANHAALFIEEICLTILENNQQAKRPVLIEISLFFEGDSVLIIERDSGELFDLTDPDLSVRGFSGFVLNGLMAAHRDEKAYLVTTGYNRNMIRFSRC